MSVMSDLLKAATDKPRSAHWEVVIAHIEGRVLHFNGAQCYILSKDGSLTVTDTSHTDAKIEHYSPETDFAKTYIAQNHTRPASASSALSLARTFGLL